MGRIVNLISGVIEAKTGSRGSGPQAPPRAYDASRYERSPAPAPSGLGGIAGRRQGRRDRRQDRRDRRRGSSSDSDSDRGSRSLQVPYSAPTGYRSASSSPVQNQNSNAYSDSNTMEATTTVIPLPHPPYQNPYNRNLHQSGIPETVFLQFLADMEGYRNDDAGREQCLASGNQLLFEPRGMVAVLQRKKVQQQQNQSRNRRQGPIHSLLSGVLSQDEEMLYLLIVPRYQPDQYQDQYQNQGAPMPMYGNTRDIGLDAPQPRPTWQQQAANLDQPRAQWQPQDVNANEQRGLWQQDGNRDQPPMYEEYSATRGRGSGMGMGMAMGRGQERREKDDGFCIPTL